MKLIFLTTLVITLFSFIFSNSSKASDNLVESFRCEKFSDEGLSGLKMKLIEKCNLEKPFSSTMSKTMGGEEVYMYCCHIKK